MINRYFRVLFIMTVATVVLNSCSKDDDDSNTPPPPAAAMTARDSAVQDYNDNYLGSAISDPGWSGNTSTCNAGRVSQASHDAVIKRINYFRRLVGLNDDCVLDTSLFEQEQQAALMMTANGALSHSPPTTWSCYTSIGAAGAGSSNIALGTNSSGSIKAFIQDNGAGNTAAGHRRWILHTNKKRFSYGSTTNAMALYVFYTDVNNNPPDYVAYPPKGYIPQALVFARWSLSIPGADFSSATVTMTGPSGNVPLIIDPIATGIGDNSIVWEPTGVDITNAADVNYTVTVSGIQNSDPTSFTYTTTIIKP